MGSSVGEPVPAMAVVSVPLVVAVLLVYILVEVRDAFGCAVTGMLGPRLEVVFRGPEVVLDGLEVEFTGLEVEVVLMGRMVVLAWLEVVFRWIGSVVFRGLGVVFKG